MFLKESQRVDVGAVIVEDRQRSSIEDEDLRVLADSMRRIGLIHPIVLTKDFRLVAGERRLRAAQALGWKQIDARFNNTQDPNEIKIIELEENVKRVDLVWQDKARAVGELHKRYLALDPEWTVEKTGEVLGMVKGGVSQYLGLAEEIAKGNAKVAQAEQMSQARTAIKRDKRRIGEEMHNALFGRQTPEAAVPNGKPVICADFIEWSAKPQVQHDVIHCDFPYGVNMDKSGQVSQALGTYADTEDVYFRLLWAFVKNYPNFAKPVSHIIFWFSMKYYVQTVNALEKIPNAKVFEHPLIWHKSDGRGIVSDPMRRYRHTYETALFVSVGDRTIIKPVNDSIAHPLDESRDHVSRKPPAVVEHFLSGIVEANTKLLDPTCGSGSALVAGRALGAEVFGVEMNEEYVRGIKL